MKLEASFTSRLLHGEFLTSGYQGMPAGRYDAH